MNNHFFVDIHCHPSIKAYAKSFRHKQGQQSADPRHESSIWCRDKPSFFDKLKNYIATLTNFIQSDASSLIKGRVSVVCLSFYPQEKGFFKNKFGDGLPADLMTMLVTEFGRERINTIQNFTSYWDDMLQEMDFLLQQEGATVKVDNKQVTYRIARSYEDIELAMREENTLGENTIFFVPTIEGLHVMDQVMDSNEDWQKYPKGVSGEVWPTMLQRAKELRIGSDQVLRPVFVTFAHHFWNGLCGHEASLGSLVKCAVDQSNGLGVGITEAGKAVLHVFFDELQDEQGRDVKPLPIDIKHMSRRARMEYFELLDTVFQDRDIPVICSHCGVNGLSDSKHKLKETEAAKEGLFNEAAINLYDDEIIRIEKSGGLIGIQLDERRIGSKTALRGARGHVFRRHILYSWSKLVWNQVRHIAEVLDKEDRFAWGIQSLGTDFDGIVDPINGYWTAESLDDLDDYLLKHAYNYLKEVKKPCPLKHTHNKAITPEEIIDRVMTGNALNFFSKVM